MLKPEYVDLPIGIGANNYYAGALPSMMKPFAFLLGGDRVAGIEQLELAAQKGEFGQTEARTVLIGACSNEKRFEDYRSLLHELVGQHPANPVFYMWLTDGFIEQGEFDQGIQYLGD